MILVALAIVASTVVGVAAERRWGAQALVTTKWIVRVLLWTVLPFVAFVTINRLDLGGGVGGGLVLAWIVALVVGLLAWLAARAMDLPAPSTGALIVSTIVANTGYLGIPLCAALLGSDAIGPAVAYDVLVNTLLFLTVGFAIGAGMGTKAGETARDRIRSFVVRNPPMLAVILALVLPHDLAPDVLHDVVELLVFVILPVGFFIVGVTLSSETEEGAATFPPPMTRPVAVSIGLRLVLAPALMFGLSALTFDVPDAYIVEAGMATGVNALVVGHAYGLDLRLTSASVAWTTALVVAGAVVVALV
ncbi:MAG TPA: AEC family transporter [Solirubrobacteraceae bacterium]|nr:AEC family transporter [Solirubrobacteraceae bacterium]